MPSDPGHTKQREPPGSAEETDPHRAEGEAGSGEHDPDVFQRLIQGNDPNTEEFVKP